MKVSAKQYARALYELTEGKSEKEIDGVITDLVARMKKNGHLKFSQDVIALFEKEYNDANSIVTATVVSAFPLQETQKDSVESYIKDRYSATQVIAEYCEDKSVKGGVVITVGDEVLDASVSGKLKQINQALSV